MRFSKIVVENYETKDGSIIRKGNIYQLFDEVTLFGLLIASDKLNSYLTFNGHTYIINKSLEIKEETTSTLIGHFEFKNWTIFKGSRYSLFLSGSKYQLIKKKKKNHSEDLCFILLNDDTQISYTIHFNLPKFSLGNVLSESAFDGTIETNHNNPLTVLLGLYLIDRAVDNETIP